MLLPNDIVVFKRSNGETQTAIVENIENGLALIKWEDGPSRFLKLVSLDTLTRVKQSIKPSARWYFETKYFLIFLVTVGIAAIIRYHHQVENLRYCRYEHAQNYFGTILGWLWPCKDISFDEVVLETIRSFLVHIPQAVGESIGSFLRPCFGDSWLSTIAFLFCVSFVFLSWSLAGLFLLFASYNRR